MFNFGFLGGLSNITNYSECTFYSTGVIDSDSESGTLTMKAKYPSGNSDVLQRGRSAAYFDGTGYGQIVDQAGDAASVMLSGDFAGDDAIKLKLKALSITGYHGLLGSDDSSEGFVRINSDGYIQVYIASNGYTFSTVPVTVDTVHLIEISRVGNTLTLVNNGTAEVKTSVSEEDMSLKTVGIYGTGVFNGLIWNLSGPGFNFPMINVGESIEYGAKGTDYNLSWQSFSGDAVQLTGDAEVGTNFCNEEGWSENALAYGPELWVNLIEQYTDENNYSTYDSETGICRVVSDGTYVILKTPISLIVGGYYQFEFTELSKTGLDFLTLQDCLTVPGDPTGADFFDGSKTGFGVATATNIVIKRAAALGCDVTFKLSVKQLTEGIVPSGFQSLTTQYPGPIRPNQVLKAMPCVQGDGVGYFETDFIGGTEEVHRFSFQLDNTVTINSLLAPVSVINFAEGVVEGLAFGATTGMLTDEYVLLASNNLSGRSGATGATKSIAIGSHNIECIFSSSEWQIWVDGERIDDTHVGVEVAYSLNTVLRFLTSYSGVWTADNIAISNVKLYDENDNLIHNYPCENVGSSPERIQDVVGGNDAIGQSISTTLYSTTDEKTECWALEHGFSVDWVDSEDLIVGDLTTGEGIAVINEDATHTVTFSESGMHFQADTASPILIGSFTNTSITAGKKYRITTTGVNTSGSVKIDQFPGFQITAGVDQVVEAINDAFSLSFYRADSNPVDQLFETFTFKEYHTGITLADSDNLMPDGTAPQYPAQKINSYYHIPDLAFEPTGPEMQTILGTSDIVFEDMDIIDEDLQVFAGSKGLAVYSETQTVYAARIGAKLGCFDNSTELWANPTTTDVDETNYTTYGNDINRIVSDGTFVSLQSENDAEPGESYFTLLETIGTPIGTVQLATGHWHPTTPHIIYDSEAYVFTADDAAMAVSRMGTPCDFSFTYSVKKLTRE